jgi:putative flippase GtrA
MRFMSSHQERNRFLKFSFVGIIGALVDFGVMNLLIHLFTISLTIAGSVSFVCAVLSNFFWNRYLTYPDSRTRPILYQLGMFFLVNIAGAAIRIPILFIIEPIFLKPLSKLTIPAFISPDVLAKNLTLAIAVGIVMLWNFFINRYWTYNDITS